MVESKMFTTDTGVWMPVCSGCFYLSIPCRPHFWVCRECEEACSIFVSAIAIGNYTSFPHNYKISTQFQAAGS